MLVLTRREGEAIVIGDNIRVTILSVNRGQARIGIDAPKDLPVDREEIRDAKERNPHPNGNR